MVKDFFCVECDWEADVHEAADLIRKRADVPYCQVCGTPCEYCVSHCTDPPAACPKCESTKLMTRVELEKREQAIYARWIAVAKQECAALRYQPTDME